MTSLSLGNELPAPRKSTLWQACFGACFFLCKNIQKKNVCTIIMTGRICRYAIIKTQTKRNARDLKTKFFNTKGNIIMYANHENQTIEMSKTESREAGRKGTEKYAELKEYRSDFPTYKIVIKSVPAKKDPYKKLTYAYMEKFIITYHQDLLDTFNEKRGIYHDEKHELATPEHYMDVRAWFLTACPEIKNFIEDSLKRREKAKEERANAKIKITAIPTCETEVAAE